MPQHIRTPVKIQAAGNKPKIIEEYIGKVNSKTSELSLARMNSPSGWAEPWQKPEFIECSFVLRGMLRIEHDGGAIDCEAGQAVICYPGERVRYSTPGPDGAEYVAVCLPAFTLEAVNRED